MTCLSCFAWSLGSNSGTFIYILQSCVYTCHVMKTLKPFEYNQAHTKNGGLTNKAEGP